MTAEEQLNLPDDHDEARPAPDEAAAMIAPETLPLETEGAGEARLESDKEQLIDADLLPEPLPTPEAPLELPRPIPLPDTPAPAWPRRGIPAVPVGVLMLVLGVILIWPALSGGFTLVPSAVAAILIAGVAISLLAYWLRSGQRARGAFFLALWGITLAALTGAFSLALDPTRDWPLYLVGTGAAVFITYLIDRPRGRHLPVISFALVVGGLAALGVTRQIIPDATLQFARQEWRWLAAILVIGLLPLAFRRRMISP